jgi:hypothetical protein
MSASQVIWSTRSWTDAEWAEFLRLLFGVQPDEE